MRNLFKITKVAALYKIVCISSGKIMFSSMKRANCVDWLETNFPE
jgi:hypothetical protein